MLGIRRRACIDTCVVCECAHARARTRAANVSFYAAVFAVNVSALALSLGVAVHIYVYGNTNLICLMCKVLNWCVPEKSHNMNTSVWSNASLVHFNIYYTNAVCLLKCMCAHERVVSCSCCLLAYRCACVSYPPGIENTANGSKRCASVGRLQR